MRHRSLALGYVRVSTTDQAENGASLDAQRAALSDEAERRGWDLEIVADAGLSAKDMNRPGLLSALDRLDRGDADSLMAVRLDRISRSVGDFAGLLDRAKSRRFGVVLLDPALDLTSPAGTFTANMLAAVAQFERALISARTREGMAQRKAEGAKFGRAILVPVPIRKRILAEHASGRGWSAIAAALNDDAIPTVHGGAKWYPATVRKMVLSAQLPESSEK